MVTLPMPETARLMFVKIAWSYLNTPYLWGGDDPMGGVDCSGLVVECLKSVGAISLHEDMSADSMWQGWRSTFETTEPGSGVLAFWLNSEGRATHVAICWDKEYCITPDGGGSDTLTLEDAIKQNAFVKVRRIDHRTTMPKFINLFA
jgi:hypothetical protein